MKTKCPGEETVADYLEGRLSAQLRLRLENHMAECDRCLELLGIGRAITRGGQPLETTPVPAHVTQSAVNLVKKSRQPVVKRLQRSVSDILSRISDPALWGLPALAPVRGQRSGDDERVQIQRHFKEIDTQIEIEKIGRNKATIRVFLVKDRAGERNVRVTLMRGRREVSSDLPTSGPVVFENIPFDNYRIVFLRAGRSLGTYPFELKEAING